MIYCFVCKYEYNLADRLPIIYIDCGHGFCNVCSPFSKESINTTEKPCLLCVNARSNGGFFGLSTSINNNQQLKYFTIRKNIAIIMFLQQQGLSKEAFFRKSLILNCMYRTPTNCGINKMPIITYNVKSMRFVCTYCSSSDEDTYTLKQILEVFFDNIDTHENENTASMQLLDQLQELNESCSFINNYYGSEAMMDKIYNNLTEYFKEDMDGFNKIKSTITKDSVSLAFIIAKKIKARERLISKFKANQEFYIANKNLCDRILTINYDL